MDRLINKASNFDLLIVEKSSTVLTENVLQIPEYDKEHSNENLDFWLEAEKYRNSNERESIAKFIIENFIQVKNNFRSFCDFNV